MFDLGIQKCLPELTLSLFVICYYIIILFGYLSRGCRQDKIFSVGTPEDTGRKLRLSTLVHDICVKYYHRELANACRR